MTLAEIVASWPILTAFAISGGALLVTGIRLLTHPPDVIWAHLGWFLIGVVAAVVGGVQMDTFYQSFGLFAIGLSVAAFMAGMIVMVVFGLIWDVAAEFVADRLPG